MRAVKLFIFLFCISSRLFGQSCDCPAVTSCATCEGGLVSLTLRYTGTVSQTITAADQISTVFSGLVAPNATFSFVGSIPNEKFVGPNISLTVGAVANATIPSICGSVFVGNTYGSFVIVSAASKSGGPLCCSAAAIETVPPQFTGCPSNISISLPSNSCSVAGGWIAPSATDNCSVETITSTHQPTDLLPIGLTVVKYTAVDKFGNTNTCTFNVTVTDASPPIITGCPNDITIEATSSCQSVVSWTPPVQSDNCSANLSASHEPGSTFSRGTTVVTYTATDPSGNTNTCSFNVTVRDTTAPVFTNCPGDITITSTACESTGTWSPPTTTDNCAVTVSSTHQPGSAFSLGATTITYTAKDPAGNTSTCSFKLTVVTNAAPIIRGCPENVSIHTFDEETTVSWQPPEATLICGNLQSNVSHEPGTKFPVGVTTVIYEFTDGTGNSSSCSFDVNVIKDDLTFEASKAVTPNGDGVNDTWLVTNIEKFKDNSVLVVDRWGNKIYHSEGYNNSEVQWAALGPNGTRVPVGTYFYTIEVRVKEAIIRNSGFVEVVY